MAILNKVLLERLYLGNGYSDKEIANFIGIDRKRVSEARAKYGIETTISTPRIGSEYVLDVLTGEGFNVQNQKEENFHADFDILVDKKIRIEVKTAKVSNDFFKFVLTEKPESGIKDFKNRVTLENGRSRKLYRDTCDFLIFVAITDNSKFCIVLPSNEINDTLQTFSFPLSGNSKFANKVNNFEQIKNKLQDTSSLHQND